MKKIPKQLISSRLVPVVTIDDASKAVQLAKTLADNGLPLLEITFRTKAAEKSIRLIAKELPHIFIGAGTILNIEQVDAAKNAGAQFVVSPGFNPKIVNYCLKQNIFIIPGVDSPTLIEAALNKGLTMVKFFPAEQSGGIDFLKAISAPYPHMHFMPTGGIHTKNISGYLNYDKVIACGGSWIASQAMVAEKNFVEIAKKTRMAVSLIEEI